MITEIEIKDFLSIEHILLTDLENLDIVGIFGKYEGLEGYSNGSGKSSFAESIQFAITGEHRYSKFTDIKAIRKGCKRCSVRIKFSDSKDNIQIERTLKVRPKGNSTLSACIIELNGEVVSTSTSESNKYIQDYFGITPRDFMYSYFFRQKNYDTILRDRSNKRITFFEEFFEANIFDMARKDLSKKRKAVNQSLLSIEVRIENIKQDISETDVHKLEKEYMAVNSDIEELQTEISERKDEIKQLSASILKEEKRIAKLEVQIEELPTIDKEIQHITSKGTATSKDETKLKKAIDTIEKEVEMAKKELDAIPEEEFKEDDKINSTFHSLEKINVDIAVIQSNIKDKDKEISNIQVNQCTVCKRPIDSNLRSELEKSLNEEKKEYRSRIKELETRQSKFSELLNSLEKERTRINKNIIVRKDISVLITNKETILKGKKDMLLAVQDTLADLRNKLKELKAKKKTLKNKEVSIDRSELKNKNKELERLNFELDHVNNKIAVEKENRMEIESELSKISKSEKELSKLDKKLKLERRELSDLNVLDDLFNKCRGEMLSTGLAELEEHANDIISEIGAVQKTISFDTEVETQSGNIKNTLDIYLEDIKGKRVVEGLSGGEWDLVAFAIRSGLSRYKLHRLSSKIDFLVLDEVFGALDDVSKEELVSAINLFRNNFSQIFVITHTELNSLFDNNITICMGKDGISRFIA